MLAGSKKAFTLIEFLIALVIIGFIVAILVGVFSSPVKQARTDSAVTQVKDGLRQVADAMSLSATKGKATCCTTANLVSDGFLSALPAVPAGIDDGGAPVWDAVSDPTTRIGGCTGAAAATPVTVSARLTNISATFCNDYNAAVGVTPSPAVTCDNGAATNCDGTDATAPDNVGQTFCYQATAGPDEFIIVFNSGVPGGSDVAGGGSSTCQ